MEFTLLVVDDEKLCRNSIANEIERSGLPFRVLQASNGQEALGIIEVHKIDCMILDVEMPRIDGIELLMQLDERVRNEILIAILSGFHEFEYAKSALQCKVYDYMLKPITPKETILLAKRLLGELEKKQKIRQDYLALRNAVEKARPQIRLQLFQNIISGHFSREELLRQAEFLDISIETDRYLCALIEFKDETGPGKRSFEEIQIRVLQLYRLMEQCPKTGFWLEKFQIQTDQIVLLVMLEKEERILNERIIPFLNDLVRSAEEELGWNLIVSTGSVVDSLSKLSVSYSKARDALRYITIYGDSGTYTAADFRGEKQIYDYLLYENLCTWLKMGEEEKIQEEIDRLLHAASRQGVGSASLYILCNKLFSAISQVLDEYNINILQYVQADKISFSELYQLKTIEQIRGWMKSQVTFAIIHLKDRYVQNNNRLADMTKQYIDAHFAEQINIAYLAERFGYSPNYLGQIFRGCMGTSINEYMTEVRLNRAKHLLHHSLLRISEISEQVGFANSQYFVTVFKKKVGITPKEYRKLDLSRQNG